MGSRQAASPASNQMHHVANILLNATPDDWIERGVTFLYYVQCTINISL